MRFFFSFTLACPFRILFDKHESVSAIVYISVSHIFSLFFVFFLFFLIVVHWEMSALVRGDKEQTIVQETKNGRRLRRRQRLKNQTKCLHWIFHALFRMAILHCINRILFSIYSRYARNLSNISFIIIYLAIPTFICCFIIRTE